MKFFRFFSNFWKPRLSKNVWVVFANRFRSIIQKLLLPELGSTSSTQKYFKYFYLNFQALESTSSSCTWICKYSKVLQVFVLECSVPQSTLRICTWIFKYSKVFQGFVLKFPSTPKYLKYFFLDFPIHLLYLKYYQVPTPFICSCRLISYVFSFEHLVIKILFKCFKCIYSRAGQYFKYRKVLQIFLLESQALQSTSSICTWIFKYSKVLQVFLLEFPSSPKYFKYLFLNVQVL